MTNHKTGVVLAAIVSSLFAAMAVLHGAAPSDAPPPPAAPAGYPPDAVCQHLTAINSVVRDGLSTLPAAQERFGRDHVLPLAGPISKLIRDSGLTIGQLWSLAGASLSMTKSFALEPRMPMSEADRAACFLYEHAFLACAGEIRKHRDEDPPRVDLILRDLQRQAAPNAALSEVLVAILNAPAIETPPAAPGDAAE